MKHIFTTILALMASFSLFAQIDIHAPATPRATAGEEGEDEEEIPIIEKVAIDTVKTRDKYVDIVLFDDHSWDYVLYPRPGIDSTSIFDRWWNTEQIHAYKGYPKDSIPDEVDLLLIDSTHAFCCPIRNKVYSTYKFRKGREHQGVDIPLQIGDTIRAAFDGVVRYIGVSTETGGYGRLIVLRHSNGLETYYGHLSKQMVLPGEPVKAGDVIGLGGSTGRSTGPHLHFETRYMGQTFDPQRLMDFETGQLRSEMFTLKKHYFSIYSHYGQSETESKAASEALYHKVRSGDTLGKIAGKYGTTVTKICKLNGISSKKVLRIGERLRVR
ncbi:MAG: peptidoglycan DD-metalloendopeptidase family protein [Bacteroidales bacterium]|nr:peptidoglycan DD-metalloendopeptidase family protein [Bacteroidales bacterium]